ncbi:MAG: ATP-binding protein [Thermoprotei archaeon]
MGFDEAGNGWGLSSDDRTHMAIFGQPGQGKSTLLLSLMVDNAAHDEGLLLIDPHDDLKRGAEGLFSPDITLPSQGISVDPLPLGWPSSSFLLDSLRRYYGNDWGPRLEMIFRNAMKVSFVRSVFDLRDFLEDPRGLNGEREEVKKFWTWVYPRLERGSESSVLNKLDKLVSDEHALNFLNGAPLELTEMMDKGKKILISLDEGSLGSDLSSFIGSLILGHAYRAGMSRKDRAPFFVYVDEAHRFSWSELEIAMASLRKRGVFFSVASQSLEQFAGNTDPLSFSDTVAAFSVSPHTSRSLYPLFSPLGADFLASMPKHEFALRTASGGGLSAILYTAILG